MSRRSKAFGVRNGGPSPGRISFGRWAWRAGIAPSAIAACLLAEMPAAAQPSTLTLAGIPVPGPAGLNVQMLNAAALGALVDVPKNAVSVPFDPSASRPSVNQASGIPKSDKAADLLTTAFGGTNERNASALDPASRRRYDDLVRTMTIPNPSRASGIAARFELLLVTDDGLELSTLGRLPDREPPGSERHE